jgi:hypothetical protein
MIRRRPEALFVGADDLHLAPQLVAQLGLAQVADMRLGGVVAECPAAT